MAKCGLHPLPGLEGRGQVGLGLEGLKKIEGVYIPRLQNQPRDLTPGVIHWLHNLGLSAAEYLAISMALLYA